MKKLGILIVTGMLLFSSFSLIGCGGGGAEIKASSTTMGKELTDLQNAYDKGVITEEEFNKAKKEILE